MSPLRFFVALILINILLVGCAAGPKLVIRPLAVDYIEYDTVIVEDFIIPEEDYPDKDEEQIAKIKHDKEEIMEIFRSSLIEKILKKKKFSRVLDSKIQKEADNIRNALLINCTLVKFNPGSRAVRYLVGWGAGKAVFKVECVFLDKNKGEEIYRAQFESKLAGGFFGGNKKDSVKGSVNSIAKVLHDLKKR